MRNVILVLHRWVGLILGAIVIVASVSGSLLVFAEPIDRATNPELFTARIPAGGPVRLSLDSLLASARSRGPVDGLRFPDAEGRAVIVRLTRGADLFLNPYTGEVLGTRTLEEKAAGAAGTIQRLHESLLGGKIGAQIVLWTTALTVLLILGGLYLWWQDRIWRARLAASWKRINFDLHHALGFWTAAVLLCMTITGVTLNFPIVGKTLVGMDRTPEAAPRPQSQPAPGAAMLTVDAAVRAGRAALPGAELRSVGVPADSGRPISLNLRFPEDRFPGGRSRVLVDRWTGDILQVTSSRTLGLGTRARNLQRPLHTGELFGAPTQVIWCLGALALAAQAVSGVLMWWHGRPARKAAAARN